MSENTDPDRAALAQAKLDLIDAAKAADPLELVRRQPLLSVGVAAGEDALLGMNAERLFSPANLNRTCSLLARAVVLTIGAMR